MPSLLIVDINPFAYNGAPSQRRPSKASRDRLGTHSRLPGLMANSREKVSAEHDRSPINAVGFHTPAPSFGVNAVAHPRVNTASACETTALPRIKMSRQGPISAPWH